MAASSANSSPDRVAATRSDSISKSKNQNIQEKEDSTDSDHELSHCSDSPPKKDKRDSQIWQEAEEVGKLKVLCKVCEAGELRTVQILVRDVISDKELTNVSHATEGGLTPLHIASKNGHREIVKFFLDKGMSVMVRDHSKNTPLHLAAAHGHLEVAIDLLAHESRYNEEFSESDRLNLLHSTNASGLSPFGCAIRAPEPHFNVAKEFLNRSVGNPVHAIPDFSKLQLLSSFSMQPLDKPAKIFIVGDSMAGKSTLVKCLQEGKPGFSRFLIGLIASRRVTNVDAHFSGIITTDFANAGFRRVLFHDLAGHTNYFNENLLEPGDNLEHVIFIVLINLQDNPKKAADRFVYWLNFLHYHTSGYCSDGVKPSFVVVGSHKDMKRGAWRTGERFNEVITEALKRRPQLAECFNELMKPVSFDCRLFEVSEARQLRSCLHKHCHNSLYQQLKTTSPPSSCYILSQLLFDNKEIPPYLTMSELAHQINQFSSRPGLSLYKLLPTEPEKLMVLCKMLYERDRVLIFENPASPQNDLNCWVVHDVHTLLTEIDTRLATLKMPGQGESGSADHENRPLQVSDSHCGIVTRETLERVFSQPMTPKIPRRGSVLKPSKVSEQASISPSPTNSSFNSSEGGLSPHLAIDLLLKYKYCEALSKSGVDSSVIESFFFPGLLHDVGEPEPWELGTNYSFAWCVQATREDGKVIEYFLPRYLKNLLLCFIEKYIIPTPAGLQGRNSFASSSNETSAVWSRGVYWVTEDDIKINIELNDDAIILSMHSPQGSELNCLQLRNNILAMIRCEQQKWQSDIAISEFIIPFEDSFPVQTLENHRTIQFESVKEALLKGKAKVDEVELPSLLYFEPCMSLYELVKPIQDLLCDQESSLSPISRENLSTILATFGENSRLAIIQHFHFPDLSKISNNKKEELDSPELTASVHADTKEEGSVQDSSATDMLGEPLATCDELSHCSITPKGLLECLNSVSIMDTAEFLKQLEVIEANTSTSRSSSPECDGIYSDIEGDIPKDSTLTRSNGRKTSTFLPSSSIDLPFIGPPSVLKCNSGGEVYTSKEHGIRVVIPAGAISKGTLYIKVGVLLSGPFTFPTGVKPISPILWLCAMENQSYKFSKPIIITLPHYVDCDSPEEERNFAFTKAAHSESFVDHEYVFKEFSSDTAKFSQGSGTVATKHCSLMCIVHKESKEIIVEKSNYCLVSLIPNRILSSTFNMYFCLMVNLKTCIEVVKQQFPRSKIYDRAVFKFALESEGSKKQYAITIHFSNHLPNDWIIGKVGFGNKIPASAMDFFKSGASYLHDLDDEDQYPPHFTLEINGSSAKKAALLCVKFTGANEELECQKPLAPQLSGSLDGISRPWQSEDSLFSQDPLPSPAVGNHILDQHLNILISCLDVNKIRPRLRQYGVLQPADSEKLIDLSTHHKTTLGSVIETLVTLLSFKGASGLYYFKKSLEETTDGTGHQDILRELQEDLEFMAIVNDYQDQLAHGASL